MAVTFVTERTVAQPMRGIKYTLIDAGSPDQNALYIRAQPSQVSINNGGYNHAWARDENGDFMETPQKTAQAGPSTITLSNVIIYGFGGESAIALPDVFLGADVGTTYSWTSHQASSNADFVYNFYVQTQDAGTNKGATLVYANCVPQPGSSMTFGGDHVVFTGTLESQSAVPLTIPNS